jgi:diguanylate cyclase (GGDEF)-like protein/PAS domain S-box-containing protein
MKPTRIDTNSLIRRLQTGVVVHGPDTRVLYANPKALELLRLSEDQALGRTAFDPEWAFLDSYGGLLPLDSYPATRVQQSGESVEGIEVGITDGTGQAVTWVLCSAYPEFAAGDPDRIESIVVTFFDITRRKKSIPFEDIVALANDAVVVTDANPIDGRGPKIVYVNAAFSELTGYAPEEILGHTPRVLQGAETDRDELDALKAALREHKPVRTQLLNYRKDGSPYWIEINIAPLRNEFGEVVYYAAIEHDVTELKERELDLRELSMRDPLTGLHNRRGFLELTEHAGAILRRDSSSATVAVLDVDHFKGINDSFGHAAGDRALKTLADLLQGQLRASDVLGRMGGEEFALLLMNTDLQSAAAKAEHMRAEIEAQTLYADDGSEIRFTASIGLAPISLEAGSTTLREAVEVALATADAALYRAKLAGRNSVICSAG